MSAIQHKLKAPAKLNFFLEVLGKRPDGYHEIRTIMHAIDLCDEITLTERKRGIRLVCTDPALPTDERNLAWRAAELMRAKLNTHVGVTLRIDKKIPVGAGLGGGSSDAAAVLKGLNRLWRLQLSPKELMGMAAQIGADCAFFIHCGTAICEGKGEIVTPISCPISFNFVLLCPSIQVSTAQVYANLTFKDLTEPRHHDSIIRKSIEEGDVFALGRALFNRLEGPAFRLYPELRVLKERLSAVCPLGTLMTGSGSALFGIVDQENSEKQEVTARTYLQWHGRVLMVKSFAIKHSYQKGGGSCEDHRRADTIAGRRERPTEGLLQRHL